MKSHILLLIFMLIMLTVQSQNIGIGTNSPSSSAKLEIESTVSGLLIPRMTTVQRMAIINPANGLLVFDTDSNNFFFFYSTGWIELQPHKNTLDQAYNEGGSGAGRTIMANNGVVHIAGEDGLLITGTFGSGDTVGVSGAGTRMFFNPNKGAFRAGVAEDFPFSGTDESGYWDNDSIGNYSLASGIGTMASGEYSTATGYYTEARGDYSTAMGSNAVATGIYSMGLGRGVQATGGNSTAFGSNSTASGSYSTALGHGTQATAVYSTAMGFGTQANGGFSMSMGGLTQAWGTGSTAMGSRSQAIGFYSTAMGYDTRARAIYSTAMGYRTEARSFGETVIGIGESIYTVSTNGLTQFRMANGMDRLFVVGNAIDINSNNLIDLSERSNALTILKNGNTGFGNNASAPTNLLHLNNGDIDPLRIENLVTDNSLEEILVIDTAGVVHVKEVSTIPSSSSNTLDQAYDQGGNGVGKTITADSGAVHISGEDGFLVTGSYGIGDTTDLNGAGTRMFFNPRKSAFRAGSTEDYVFTASADESSYWDNQNIGNYSFAGGMATLAQGDYSTALGHFTEATGDHATAFGSFTKAEGDLSTAMGGDAIASGHYSTAIGFGTRAESSHSVAIGRESVARYSLVAMALGWYAEATGRASLATGYFSIARGDYSTTMGIGNISKAYGSTTIGTFSDTATSASTTSYTSTDRLFTIGNGTSNTYRSNALTMLKNGRIGLNNVNPTNARLEMFSDSDAIGLLVDQNYGVGTVYGIHVDLDHTSGNSGTSYAIFGTSNKVGATNNTLYGIFGSAVDEQYGLGTRVIVGVRGHAHVTYTTGTSRAYGVYGSYFGNADTEYAGYFAGSVYTTGTYLPSDMSLKDRVEQAESSLHKIRDLNVKTYEYKTKEHNYMNLPEGRQTGFIVQDFALTFPELVKETVQPAADSVNVAEGLEMPHDEVDFQAINYTGLIPHLVKSIQEQQELIETLETEVADLRGILEELD